MYKNNPNPSPTEIRFGLSCLGTSVFIGLFEKVSCTNTFPVSDLFRFDPHPYGMRLILEGLSHGLNSPPDCFYGS